ncbi:MAG TPA: hypothetical protein PKA41_02240 [Verrucomicrobiota bacterium]|nr:hypothetical protein [Verrucomicrobiota bacterium]
MKPKLILKSLADIPANTLSLAASMPGRTVNVSRQVLGPAVRATRREFQAARQTPAAYARDIYSRARGPFQSITPWPRGGLNE